jgi:hypothetical protein
VTVREMINELDRQVKEGLLHEDYELWHQSPDRWRDCDGVSRYVIQSRRYKGKIVAMIYGKAI